MTLSISRGRLSCSIVLTILCFRGLKSKDKKELVQTYSVYKVSKQNDTVCEHSNAGYSVVLPYDVLSSISSVKKCRCHFLISGYCPSA